MILLWLDLPVPNSVTLAPNVFLLWGILWLQITTKKNKSNSLIPVGSSCVHVCCYNTDTVQARIVNSYLVLVSLSNNKVSALGHCSKVPQDIENYFVVNHHSIIILPQRSIYCSLVQNCLSRLFIRALPPSSYLCMKAIYLALCISNLSVCWQWDESCSDPTNQQPHRKPKPTPHWRTSVRKQM